MTTTIDNEQKTLNVPNLRFPEFQGEWENCKVSELLDFYSTNSLSWDKLEYGTNAIQNLHYGLIHVGLPTMVDLDNDKLPNIVSGNTPKNYELCQEGDIAFADASEDTNEVAKAVEFYNLNGKDVICGLHTIHGRDNQNKTIVGYKGYAFSSMAFHQQIRRIAQGTKIYSINNKNFSECYIGIPSKREQKKIATLLRLIDERISTQNKIIEKLQSLIKGISNRLLYADNSMSIRIEEMLIERSERTKKNNQYEILSSTVNGIFSQRDYFSKDIASDNNVGYKIVHLHDIVLSPQNLWMGNINFNDKFDIGIVSPSYKVFSIADGFDKKYVAALLKTHHALYNYMLVSEQGASTVRRNLNYEAFEQLVFKIPSLNKQQEIGHVISLLKSQLENANLLIKTYNSQKQYLLRQMFI